RQFRLALDEGFLAEVLTVQGEQVEHVERKRSHSGPAVLQRVEVRAALRVEDDDLAVEGRTPAPGGQLGDDRRGARCEGAAVPGVELNIAVVDLRDRAKAVPFDLAEPVG